MTSIVKTQRNCEICGANITSKYGKRFCSPPCRAQFTNRVRWGAKKIRLCALCGATISSRNAKQFCSIVCRNTALARRAADKKRKPKPERLSKKITWSADMISYLTDHYASDGGESVAAHLRVSIDNVRNKAYRLGMRQDRSTTQRTTYDVSSERMRRDNPMKRSDVQLKVQEWWDNNPDKIISRNEKLVEGRQRIQKDKPNKLEQKMYGILQSLNVPYESQVIIKPLFIVDVRIGKLIIQVDGEYWHGHPRFDPLTDRQIKQRQRDKAQDAYLVACGYTVVRIWERDIHRDHIARVLELQHAATNLNGIPVLRPLNTNPT